MDNRKVVFAATTLLVAALIMAQVEASPGPTIALNPSSVRDLEPNASFTVDVTIADADNIYGWQVNLTFTPGVLTVTEVTEGPFLMDVNQTVWPSPQINNEKGYVQFSSSLWVPYPPQGVSGSGRLGTITFKVESGGSTALKFDTKKTFLLRVVEGVIITIPDLALQDGSFTGTGGGLQLPLEVIAGAIVAVAVVVVVAVFYLKRRRQ